jgi:hypothetical protein
MSKHNTRGRGGQPIYAAGRIVGTVRGDTFFKSIQFSRHALRTPPALALDLGSLADAEHAGARYVEIRDTETGRVFKAAVGTIRARGWTIDRGYGRQIALGLGEWARDAEPAAEQMAFSLAT